MTEEHPPTSPEDPFADVWEANARFAREFPFAELSGHAAHGLAVLTCMDTRIDPLSVLGLQPGDAKVLRTAGARVTDDALRSLVLAVQLLGARRILVIAHTDCGLIGGDDAVRAKLASALGVEADDPDLVAFDPRAIASPSAALAEDVVRIRAHPLIGDDVTIGAAVYDVRTGVLEPHRV